MTERIHQTLQPHWGKRLFILYGLGVEDAFIDHEHQEQSIELSLLGELKNKGFERVIFTSPHQSIYFRDTGSKEKTLATRASAKKTGKTNHQMEVLNRGPFNTMQLFQHQTESNLEVPLGSMGDIHTIRFLNTIMSSSEQKSAVVFIQAETFLSQFEDIRLLSGLIGSWTKLPSENQNACFFLFSAVTHDQLVEIIPRLPVPELRVMIRQSENQQTNNALVKIDGPRLLEIERLVTKHQQLENFSVDPEQIKKIETWMVAENTSLRNWMMRLSTVQRVDLETVRSQHWFSASLPTKISAEERLQQLIGLGEIKQRIQQIADWLEVKNIKGKNKQLEHPTMHMIFTGNPGTGKTTIACLLGELLHNIGYLKRGQLVEVNGSDLIAEFVGGTAIKTNHIIDTALDGVLFIDEAYVLSESDRGGFGQEAIDTLLSRLEKDRSRLMVILAGYPEKMKRFLRSNPGLSRRFPAENILNFPDYSPDELWEILDQFLGTMQLPYANETEIALKQIINGFYARRDELFGNAGEMRNLAESLDRHRAVRIKNYDKPIDTPLLVEDISPAYSGYLEKVPPSIEKIFSEIDTLVGLEDIKGFLRSLVYRVKYEQLRKQKEPEFIPAPTMQNLVFLGNPGTGKTTVARLVGKIYHSLGLLKNGQCIEVSRSDLVAGYVGQTAIKTRGKIFEALDGVLFIDEAYSLSRPMENDFGREAIDTLVKLMEDYHDRLLVIVAGYPAEMNNFINANPGLRSRFASPIYFQNFNAIEMTKILSKLAEKEGYLLPSEIAKYAGETLQFQSELEAGQFGNARSVIDFFNQMKAAMVERVFHAPKNDLINIENDEYKTFHIDDIRTMRSNSYEIAINPLSKTEPGNLSFDTNTPRHNR